MDLQHVELSKAATRHLHDQTPLIDWWRKNRGETPPRLYLNDRQMADIAKSLRRLELDDNVTAYTYRDIPIQKANV